MTKKLRLAFEYALANQTWAKSQMRLAGSEEVDASAFEYQEIIAAKKTTYDAWLSTDTEGIQILSVLTKLNADLEGYIIKYGKKTKKYEEGEEDFVNVIKNDGPWTINTKELKKSLDEFDKLKLSKEDLTKQVSDLNKKISEKDQEIGNGDKIKKALEVRTKDLEMRCQQIPLLESEKRRYVEKDKHYSDICRRLEEENKNLKERLKSGNFTAASLTGARPEGGKGAAGNKNVQKRFQNVFKKISLVRQKQTTSLMKNKDYTYIQKHEVNCLSKYLQKLNKQLIDVKGGEIAEKFHSLQRDMPFFKQYMTKAKNHDKKIAFSKEASKSLGKVQAFTSAVKHSISSNQLVDCTPKENESNIARVERLMNQVKRQEMHIDNCVFKATKELDKFKSKWASVYTANHEFMSSSSAIKEATEGAKNNVIGKVSFGPSTKADDL